MLPDHCNIDGVTEFTIEAYDIPDVAINADDYFICEEEEITSNIIEFDDGNFDIYVIDWFVDGIYHSSDSSAINPILVPFDSFGEHSIEAIAANICGADSSDISVLVYENPEITTASLPGECLGNTLAVGAFGADDYSWSSNNPILSNSGNSATYLVSGSATETVTGTINYQFESCSSDTTFDIIAYPLPIIDIVGDFSICDQEELGLTTSISGGTPNYVVSWSEDNLSTIEEDFITIVDPTFTSLTAYVVDENGCEDSDEISVEVYNLPIVDAGSDVQFCDQSILTTLNENNPFGGVWDGLGIQNEFTGEVDPSIIGVGTSLVFYEYTDSNGCVNNDSLTIEVIPPTFANAGPDIAVCNIDTVIILDSYTPLEGNWTGDFISNSAPYSLDISDIDPGLYSFFYDYGEGTCFTQDAMILEVYERPNVYWDGPETLCLYESGIFELTIEGGTGPYFIEWLSDVDLIVNDGYTIVNSWDAVGTHELELFVTDFNGCSNYLSFEIDVIDLPVVDAGPDTTFCYQTNYTGQLEGFSPGLNEDGTGSFYGLGDAEAAVSEDGIFDPAFSGVGIFEVVYSFTSNETGCTNTDTLTIMVNDPIVADAGLDTVVCFNAPMLQLEGYYPTIGVLWSGTNAISSNALMDSQAGLINPQLLPPGDYTYLLETGSGTCYSFDFVTVTVDPLPVLELSGNDVFCVNDGIVPLTDFTPQGGTWEGTGVVDAISGTFDAGTGVGIYDDLFYWYTDPTTNCSDTISHQVIVQEIPVVYAGPDTSFCNQPIPGQIEGFSPGFSEGGTGFFYGLGDADGAVTPTGQVDPSLTGVGEFEVVYSFTSNETGCTNTDTLTIMVNDPIVADAGLDTVVCFNAPMLQLEGYYPTIGVLWSGTNAISSNALMDSQAGLINPQLLPPGDYTYLLETGSGTCYSFDFVTVTVDPLPVLELSGNDVFCVNDGIVPLTDFTPQGGTWEGVGVVDAISGTFDAGTGVGIYDDLFYWYTDPTTNCSDTISIRL